MMSETRANVSFNINLNQLWIYILRLLSLLGVALVAFDPSTLPASMRVWVTPAAAVILAVDRYVTDPSSGNPTTPPGPGGTPVVPHSAP